MYPRLPHPLVPGHTHTVTLDKLNTRQAQVALRFEPASVRSEAVHVSQVGFRPYDPVKEGRLPL